MNPRCDGCGNWTANPDLICYNCDVSKARKRYSPERRAIEEALAAHDELFIRLENEMESDRRRARRKKFFKTAWYFIVGICYLYWIIVLVMYIIAGAEGA